MVLAIKLYKNKALLLLSILLSSCSTPHSTEQAVADYDKALGLVQSEVEVEGQQKQVWQFLLCDRLTLLHAETDKIKELLTNSEVCYNPLVDADNGAAVFLAQPDTSAARSRAAGRWLVKGGMIAGAGVLAFFSIKFGFKTWKWFSNMEEYIRFTQRLKRVKAAEDLAKRGLKKKNRLLAWVTGGGVVGFLAWFFLVGDGAFSALGHVWNINKTYFNKGKQVVLEWGLPEQTFINDYPYLVNDAWRDTKKTDSIDRLLLGIKNTLQCEFSPRYLAENPLRRAADDK